MERMSKNVADSNNGDMKGPLGGYRSLDAWRSDFEAEPDRGL